MHKIYVQRKEAQLSFPSAQQPSSPLPPFLKTVDWGGVQGVYPNSGPGFPNTPSAKHGFETTTLVLTTMLSPVTYNGNKFNNEEPRYEKDIVELYLIHIASVGAAGLRTPAQWHNCKPIDPKGAYGYTGKYGCPLIITQPPNNQMIVHHVSGVFKYGVNAQGNDLTTFFNHYLIQMILPNQSLCYYAVPATEDGEQQIVNIQNQINNAHPGAPLAVGANDEMKFYDDLQMWIFTVAVFAF